jgi:hypothetical protein
MKRKPITTLGALHPILFFAGVYVVALFFSIFICSSIFYSINSTETLDTVSKTENSIDINHKSLSVASV